VLRSELEPLIPLLQSGSLFGARQGLQLVDAQLLTASEAEVLAGLIETADPQAVAMAVVATGAVPKSLAAVLERLGEKQVVRKLWERQAGSWLAEEAHRRNLDLDASAVEALVHRFGSDTASLSQVLDQLAQVPGKITAALILDRFRNRPDEPIFLYIDAVTSGDVGEALRRLGDQLVHNHPLQLLGALEAELRRKALAAAAPDRETLVEWAAARPSDKWVDRAWRDRGAVPDSSLRRGLEALTRADRVLKTAPEELHRVTMERLTVAVCRYLSPRGARRGSRRR
jgi:DNA polymerase III delta subunit